MEAPYVPISCSFYDYIEEAATLKKEVVIEFKAGDETASLMSGVKTLEIENKVEYMILTNGMKIRLDRIVSFDNKKLTNHC